MIKINLKLKKFVRKIHKGDTRNDGSPFVKHLFRVADYVQLFTNKQSLINISLFHDSIEMHDSFILRRKLRRLGIFDEVMILSHFKGESYQEYLERIVSYPFLIVVKICDMVDNLTNHPSERAKKKYRDGLLFLLKYW